LTYPPSTIENALKVTEEDWINEMLQRIQSIAQVTDLSRYYVKKIKGKSRSADRIYMIGDHENILSK
jgi:hypothetical protein